MEHQLKSRKLKEEEQQKILQKAMTKLNEIEIRRHRVADRTKHNKSKARSDDETSRHRKSYDSE